MYLKSPLLLTVTLLVAALPCLNAQMTPTPGLNAALVKLFGNQTNFTAKAEVKMLGENNQERLSMPMEVSMLNGMLRSDIDVANMKSADMPPSMVNQITALGINKAATILRPGKQTTLNIFPNLKAWMEAPLPAGETVGLQQNVDVSKTQIGKETVDGHPCEKTKVVVSTGPDRQEAIVWYATDLKGFPVRMEMKQSQGAVTMNYRDIKLVKPNAALFTPPTDYTQYKSIQELLQSVMLKNVPGMK